MKTCTKCGELKEETDFNFRNKIKGIRSYQCRDCNKANLKRHYYNNKDYYIKKSKKNKINTVNWYNDIKSKLKCIKCGENHAATLDFHHRNPNIKEYTVSTKILVKGRKNILEEISKCDVLCSNCHRKLHWEERNIG